jgi:amidase
VELWEKQDANKSRWLAWMKNYDVVLCPTAGKPAQPINLGTQINTFKPGGGYTGMFNTTGYPSVVVRAGTSPEKLPIGVMLTSPLWRDDIALAAAAFIEGKTGGWQRPPI